MDYRDSKLTPERALHMLRSEGLDVTFEQAQEILETLGLPSAQQNVVSALTLLALAQLSEKDAWKIQPEDMGNLVLDILKINPRVLPSKIEFRATKPAN